MGIAQSAPVPPPKYVLVPPVFDTDREYLRERFLWSPYEYLFGKAELKRLFQHYYDIGGGSLGINFAPAGEPEFYISAKGSVKDFENCAPNTKAGEVVFRYQPHAKQLSNFIDVKVTPAEQQSIVARGSYLHPTSGLAISGIIPFSTLLQLQNNATESLDNGLYKNDDQANVTLKFATKDFCVGATSDLVSQRILQIWGIARKGPFMIGTQMGCDIEWQGVKQPDTLLHEDYKQANIQVAYTTKGTAKYGEGHFMASMELQHFNQICLSFFQHLPVRRDCYNPFEDENVVGVTDYVDLGLSISTPVQQPPQSPNGHENTLQNPNMQFGLSWQFGKNWLAKCALGLESIQGALVFRSWGQPGLIAGVSAKWDWGQQGYKCGCSIQFENEGVRTYERARPRQLQGRSVLQKHLASNADVMMGQGQVPSVEWIASNDLKTEKVLI